MSLRAKLEAVIYAAEEPVTLAQLSTLFAAEALEERASREQAIGGLPARVGELFESRAQTAQTAESAAEEHSTAPASDAAIEQAIEYPGQVSATQPDGFAGEPAADHGPEQAAAEEDARRAGRLREREARDEIRRLVDELIAEYESGDRGMEIREIAGGYRVATRPEYHDAVRGFVRSLKPQMKLSLQALETLAVIAYKQPVTAPEVSEIRGVDSGGVMGSLISRKLVTTAGRKQVIGRPILYKTTKEFLLRFGLKDLAELPSMEEFEKMAGELVEGDAAAQLEFGEPTVNLRVPQSAGELNMEDTAENIGDEEAAGTEGAIRVQPSATPEPSDAEDVQAAPEVQEGLDDQELAAKARATVKVDDESASYTDLPGVTRDTAGKLELDTSRYPSRSDPDSEAH